MCGIAGMQSLCDAPVDRGLLHRMVRSLSHRGPDGCGTFVDGSLGLGHCRLSIVDLAGGHQPMTTDDGSLSISFNGEIFNYLELRDDLIARGHQFRTKSDTEVILHLYREYGDHCLRFLNGEWAFALWDASRKRLLLSRDRFGVRPLFYTAADRTLLFASEIKALFQHPGVERQLDLETLDQLFTFWAPLPGRTVFRDVFEVRPGQSLVVEKDHISERSYWQLPVALNDRVISNEDEATERLVEMFTDAVRLRLRADVPVGAYLSGGLDSTFATAVAARLSPTLQTFSITFNDPSLDEREYQLEATRHLRTAHDACHCSEDDIARVFPDVIWHTERPVLRTAPAPMFLLAKRVRERGFKVVVTGEGADELFGGYDIYKEAKIRRYWASHPGSTQRPLLLRRLYPYMPSVQSQPPAYLRAFFRVSEQDCHSPFFAHLPRWGLTSRLKRFYSSDVRATLQGYDPLAELEAQLPSEYSRWDDLGRAEYLETALLLPGFILSAQGDRMGMAHAVEGRFPFLDHRVAEFAASLSPRLKMRALNEKYLLKRAASGFVPPAIIRRNKQPYRAPDANCFVHHTRKSPEYVSELLSPQKLSEFNIFDPSAVTRLLAKARREDTLGVKDSMSVIGVLSTQLLIDRFVRTGPDARN